MNGRQNGGGYLYGAQIYGKLDTVPVMQVYGDDVDRPPGNVSVRATECAYSMVKIFTS